MIAIDTSFNAGNLFADVQAQKIFADQKTFADAVPLYSLPYIAAKYAHQKEQAGFSLMQFVRNNFMLPGQLTEHNQKPKKSIDDHIFSLWDKLTRTNTKDNGSLIGLPHSYVTPGGRFEEQYYWDSYFTMLGLVESDRVDLVEGMIDNFTYLINTIGFIPNANRTYYLTRSQIPFYSAMIRLLEEIKGPQILIKYLPTLQKEHEFWMKGSETLDKENNCCLRVVRMESGALLNRYWDTENTPRPEGYALDVAVKMQAPDNKDLYRNIRAACESGWDFSSRWLSDGKNLHSICTTDIVPVDLNCMLLHMEKTILAALSLSGNVSTKKKYEHFVAQRTTAIEKYLWDEDSKVYKDYNFKRHHTTSSFTLAMLFPLYIGISSIERAAAVLSFVKKNMLMEGGLLTTNVKTKQQWDAVKGWAPLQWIGYAAALNYGNSELSENIKKNWMRNIEQKYSLTGHLMEKYPVVITAKDNDTGGEYPNQDGFGWTNGVYLKMKRSMI